MERFPNLIIRASAGTGKTYQLANRFIGLLLSNVPLDEILAVTFTRKAAGEILDRVLLKLAEAAADPAACRTLSSSLQDAQLTPQRCQDVLRRVVRHLHRLRISTLDSFFTQLAGSYSLELGFPPGWRIVDPFDEARLRDQAVESLLRDHSTQDIARLMHLLSKGDVERPVAQLIRETVTELHGIYLDSPGDAWEKFPTTYPLDGEKVSALIGQLERVENLKSKFVKANQASIEMARKEDWENFLAKGMPKKIAQGEVEFYSEAIPPALLEPYKELVRHAAAILIRELATQTIATRDLLERFDDRYERHRAAARALRFDDISRRLARQTVFGAANPDAFRLDTRIRHVLLDEFQDTSVPQWHVLRPFVTRATGLAAGTESANQVALPPSLDSAAKPLFRLSPAGFEMAGRERSSRSLFCVGDVKQAIYGWRGGSSKIFDVIQREIPGIQQSHLTCSYRSSQPIIDTVNQVFESLLSHPNPDDYRQALADWQANFQFHTTARSELAGYACLMTSPQSNSKEEQSNETLRYAAKQVAELTRQAPGRSIAVLTRRNNAVSRMIFELRQLGISASEEGGDALTDSAAVELILSLLRLCDHPGNSIARYHVSHSPLGAILGITGTTSSETIQELAQSFRHRFLRDGYGPTMGDLAKKLLPVVNQRDADRLMQLVELAYRHQDRATIRTDDFIRFVEQQPVPDPSPADVRVTTIHKSKGLQFDAVVLPELSVNWIGESPAVVVGRPDAAAPIDRVCRYRNDEIQQLLPNSLREIFDAQSYGVVTETLCIMYVAMTRAIHALYMVISPSAQNESTIPKSIAGLLRAALTNLGPLGPEQVCFETGDRNWTRQLSRPVPTPQVAEAEGDHGPPLVPQQGIRFAPGTSQNSLDRISPSRLEGTKRTKVAKALQLDSADALARGSIIHAWFERVSWLEDGLPSSRELREFVAAIHSRGLSVDDLLRDFRGMLKQREVARVLSRSYYDPATNEEWGEILTRRPIGEVRLEVRREQRVLSRSEGALLEGAIDRLVLIYDRDELVHADIVDFKTDKLSSRDFLEIQSRTDYYGPQLDAYRSAVSRMFHLEESCVTSRFVFVAAGRIMSNTLSSRPTQRTLF